MKVIKKGREQKGWAKEYECTGKGYGGGGCGAVLLVEQADVIRNTVTDYGGGSDTYTYFICMACHVRTELRDAPWF